MGAIFKTWVFQLYEKLKRTRGGREGGGEGVRDGVGDGAWEGARKGESSGGRRGANVTDRERERKGFTVRETNVRGEGRCGREKIGDRKKKRATVSEGAEQREGDRDDLLLPSLTQITWHSVTTIQGVMC